MCMVGMTSIMKKKTLDDSSDDDIFGDHFTLDKTRSPSHLTQST